MRYYDFDKTAARREFKKRNYLFFGMFFGAVLGMPVLISLFRLIEIEGALGFVIVPWMFAWVAVVIWRTSWKCPRCHKYFFRKWWHGNALTFHCLHCDLRPDELIEDFIPKKR